jgi:hypothetical protein
VPGAAAFLATAAALGAVAADIPHGPLLGTVKGQGPGNGNCHAGTSLGAVAAGSLAPVSFPRRAAAPYADAGRTT